VQSSKEIYSDKCTMITLIIEKQENLIVKTKRKTKKKKHRKHSSKSRTRSRDRKEKKDKKRRSKSKSKSSVRSDMNSEERRAMIA